MRVLVVEDYAPLRESVVQGLGEAGYAVDAVADGDDGLALATTEDYDVIVLDLMLPGTDGMTILRRLRAEEREARVLILTAKDGVSDRVAGLDAGADDYLIKPFAFEELVARVRTLLRRKYGVAKERVVCGDLEIDLAARRVRRGGEGIELSAKEYSILEYLALRKGQIVTRQEIWDHVYDFAAEPGSNVLDVFVSSLRKKIDRGRGQPLLRTKRGLGYVLTDEEIR